jgi:hypothetical protein
MLFWKKKKTVTLDCFTNREACIKAFQPERASKFIPTWWKNLSRGNFTDVTQAPYVTMRTCAGFMDYFANSIAVPLWDYYNFVDYGSKIEYRGNIENPAAPHPRVQFTGFLDDPSYFQFKIEVPWIFIADNKTKFIQTFPIWCYDVNNAPERIMHLPGIVDFFYQRSTNFNIFIKASGEHTPPKIITFEPGVPLMFYTPLDDVKVKIKTHLLSKEEYQQKSHMVLGGHGPNRLKILRRSIDFTNENTRKKCPFGFGK